MSPRSKKLSAPAPPLIWVTLNPLANSNQKIIADFKKDTTDLLAKTSLPASDFQEFRTLSDVKELPASTEESISALAERARAFPQVFHSFSTEPP